MSFKKLGLTRSDDVQNAIDKIIKYIEDSFTIVRKELTKKDSFFDKLLDYFIFTMICEYDFILQDSKIAKKINLAESISNIIDSIKIFGACISNCFYD